MAGYQNVGRTAMLLLTVALATAGCGRGAAGGALAPMGSLKENGTVDSVSVTAITALECGQPFQPPDGRGLTLTGRFPTTAPAGEQAITGTVEVTSREAIRGVVGRRADVFLVRDGHVVTVPAAQDAVGVRWDLAPGEVESLPGEAVLVSCDAGGVRPGMHELYVRVVVTPDDEASMEFFGGPWPLEVQ